MENAKQTSEQSVFDQQLQSLAQEMTQDWPALIEQASKKAENAVFRGERFTGPFGLTIASVVATVPFSGILDVIALTTATLGAVNVMYSLFTDYFEVQKPFAMKKARLPKPAVVKVSMHLQDDAAVVARVKSSDNTMPSKEIFLGKENQEEIAQRFLMIQEICTTATAANAKPFDPQLLAKNNLYPNGKLIEDPKAMQAYQKQLEAAQIAQEQINLEAEQASAKRIKEQEQGLLLAANKNLIEALHQQ